MPHAGLRPAVAGALAVLALGAHAAAQAAPERSPLDITTYGVILQEPAMAQAVVRRDLQAGDVPFELTTPRAPRAGERFPVVVFVNGVGADFRTWKIYTDWARLVAARGMAGVVYQSSAADPAQSLRTLIDHLVARGGELGLDSERLALWACSANVTTALPYLMATPPTQVRGAVLYYGSTPVPAIRRDLPVFYLLSERDNPQLNAGIRTLWSQAIEASAPWTMVVATGMPHAFDALVETHAARQLVDRTLGFLSHTLAPPGAAGPPPSLARQALIATYGVDWPAAAEAHAALARERPNDGDVQRGLGVSLVRAGRGAEAVEPLQQAIALGLDRADVREMLGNALLARGDNAAGVAELEQALAGAPPFRRGVVLYNLACGYARLGKLDEAFARLEQAVATGFGTRADYDRDADLAPLRSDPRYAALVARLPPG